MVGAMTTLRLASSHGSTHRWIAFAVASLVGLGSVARSHAAWAGDAPPRASADAKSAAAQATSTATDARPAAAQSLLVVKRRPLDLTAPPVERVLTPEQMRSFTTEPEDDGAPPDAVTVASPRYRDPVPNGPFVAIPWALLHPLQAWRIFAPITDD